MEIRNKYQKNKLLSKISLNRLRLQEESNLLVHILRQLGNFNFDDIYDENFETNFSAKIDMNLNAESNFLTIFLDMASVQSKKIFIQSFLTQGYLETRAKMYQRQKSFRIAGSQQNSK